MSAFARAREHSRIALNTFHSFAYFTRSFLICSAACHFNNLLFFPRFTPSSLDFFFWLFLPFPLYVASREVYTVLQNQLISAEKLTFQLKIKMQG